MVKNIPWPLSRLRRIHMGIEGSPDGGKAKKRGSCFFYKQVVPNGTYLSEGLKCTPFYLPRINQNLP
jgi:hypothetical protein